MIGLNKSEIIGNVVSDSNLSNVMVGNVPTARCKFSVAVNEKRATGEPITTYFEVTLWRNQATTLAPFIKKGRLIHVEGSVRLHQFTGSDRIPRASMQIHDAKVLLLDRKPVEETVSMPDDDVPFI